VFHACADTEQAASSNHSASGYVRALADEAVAVQVAKVVPFTVPFWVRSPSPTSLSKTIGAKIYCLDGISIARGARTARRRRQSIQCATPGQEFLAILGSFLVSLLVVVLNGARRIAKAGSDKEDLSLDALEKLIFRNQDTVSGCVQIRLETSSAGDLVSGKSENSHQTQPRLVTAAQ